MSDLTDDQVKTLLDEMTREVICGELGKALAERIGRALLDARAELAATQTQVGDWIVRADEANVKVEKLEPAELARVRADATAAQALVLEQAAKVPRLHAKQLQQNGLTAMSSDFDHIEAAIRALAPADGLAAVEALRARAEKAEQERDRIDQWRETAIVERDTYSEERDAAEAERDRLVAENAALEAKVAGLVSYGDPALGGSPLTDETPAQHEERTCTCGAGHGSLEGHTDWCDFTAYQSLEALADIESARAALAQTPTDPGDGWTWNERLGWIGPDGKPADPRRRG